MCGMREGCIAVVLDAARGSTCGSCSCGVGRVSEHHTVHAPAAALLVAQGCIAPHIVAACHAMQLHCSCKARASHDQASVLCMSGIHARAAATNHVRATPRAYRSSFPPYESGRAAKPLSFSTERASSSSSVLSKHLHHRVAGYHWADKQQQQQRTFFTRPMSRYSRKRE